MTHTYYLFPNKVIEHQCDDFCEIRNHLIDYTYHLKEREKSKDYTIVHGWQSTVNLQVEESFQPFMPFLHRHMMECCRAYGFDLDRWVIEFSACVLNVNMPGSYQLSHVHTQCHMSGVLWVDGYENSGNLVFQNPDCLAKAQLMESMFLDLKIKENIVPYYHFRPLCGTMILFPPDLRHHVETNLTDKDRISLGFNLHFSERR